MIEIYDIETYKRLFLYCAMNRDTKQMVTFEISWRKNDIDALIKHLSTVKGQIGFNNLSFDYPVIHWLLLNYKKYTNGKDLAEAVYNKAQEVIDKEFSSIKDKEVKIPQLDLFRIWHFNNKARGTSLKYLEFNMRMKDIRDLPFDIHGELTSEQIDEIISYCQHDVNSTYLFYTKSIGKIELRKKLEAKYKLPLLNKSDVGIAEELVLDSYCKLTSKDKDEVKKTNTKYNIIKGEDVILPLIKFETTEMIKWLDKLKNTTLKKKEYYWKGEIIKLFNEEYQVGLGGIHHNTKPCIYKSDNNKFLTESDCAGMYPTFISLHNQYPAHLGKDFLTLYKQIREDRMIAKKIGDKLMDAAGKLMGNGTFGKFGSDLSYLYDLKMLYTVTLNNQLFLLMLIEQCGLNNIKVVSANTDSITVFDSTDKLPIFQQIKSDWERISLHTLEDTNYNLLVFRDVNNYIAQTTDNKIKYKGAFDTFEDITSDKFDGWHKNHSMLIVPIAISNYFIKGIPIDETILNHTNIYDFCKVVKGKKGIKFVYRTFSKGILQDIPLQKINRYIVSNSNGKLIKQLEPLRDDSGNLKKDKINNYRKDNPLQRDLFHFVEDVIVEKNRESEIEAGYNTTILNRIESEDIKNYDINYNYYIKQAKKIIKSLK